MFNTFDAATAALLAASPPEAAQDPLSQADALISLLRDDALQLWSTTGLDRTNGGCFEQLDLSGRAIADTNKRVRVQFRQIFVFAEAHALGWMDGRAAVEWLFEFVSAKALSDDLPGCAHLLSPDGTVLDNRRDLYDQAFILLGMATAYRAFGDLQYLELAERTMDYLDDVFAHPNGGWRESDQPVGNDPRRQNPHMHLFEAFQALYRATNDKVWLSRAQSVRDLFGQHFFDPGAGVLLEYFEQDWQPAEAEGQRRVEPGHMAEWVWLLQRYGALGTGERFEVSRNMLETAVRLGLNPGTGLLFDEITDTGEPLVHSHRTWPQTELIKALTGWVEHGLSEATPLLGAAIERLLSVFCNTGVPGIWMDQIDTEGKPAKSVAPASTMYHIVAAASEVARIRDKLA